MLPPAAIAGVVITTLLLAGIIAVAITAAVVGGAGDITSPGAARNAPLRRVPPLRVLPPRSVFMTCTTTLDSTVQDNWVKVQAALDGLRAVHSPEELGLLHTVLVVNEYSPGVSSSSSGDRWAARFAEAYPWVTFYQKTNPDRRGQAASLNFILAQLAQSGCPWWLQWEEAWAPKFPFLALSVATLASTPQLDHLDCSEVVYSAKFPPYTAQLLRHATRVERVLMAEEITARPPSPLFWLSLTPAQLRGLKRLFASEGVFGLATSPDRGAATLFSPWPLWTLRPSFNRASTLLHKVGQFREDPILWPILFEWDYAVRFLLAGGTKATWGFPPAKRFPGHRSSYAAKPVSV